MNGSRQRTSLFSQMERYGKTKRLKQISRQPRPLLRASAPSTTHYQTKRPDHKGIQNSQAWQPLPEFHSGFALRKRKQRFHKVHEIMTFLSEFTHLACATSFLSPRRPPRCRSCVVNFAVCCETYAFKVQFRKNKMQRLCVAWVVPCRRGSMGNNPAEWYSGPRSTDKLWLHV